MITVTDTILRHAIASIGANPDELEETREEDRDEIWRYDPYDEYGRLVLKGDETAYQVTCIKIIESGFVTVRWLRPSDRQAIRYEFDEIGGVITVESMMLADAVLDGMAGRPLTEAVGMPGAEEYRIVTAVNSKAFISDPMDLRIQVDRIPQDNRRAA